MDHLQKYYDTGMANIGRYNSFVRYGSRWEQTATCHIEIIQNIQYSKEGEIRVPFILYYSSLAGGEGVDD